MYNLFFSWQALLDSFEKERDQRIALCGSEEKYKEELKEIRVRAHLENTAKLNGLARKFKECEE